MTELDNNQKEMISELLIRTHTKDDIKDNIDRILGNAYGDKNTAETYKELAEIRIKTSLAKK